MVAAPPVVDTTVTALAAGLKLIRSQSDSRNIYINLFSCELKPSQIFYLDMFSCSTPDSKPKLPRKPPQGTHRRRPGPAAVQERQPEFPGLLRVHSQLDAQRIVPSSG